MPDLETQKNKIRGFYRNKHRMPSYAELAKLFGFKSRNSAVKLVEKLKELGVLAIDATGKLIPKELGETIRVLGSVEAGWPSPAEEELLDTLTLDDYLIRNKEATYILNVTGRSMVNAGILPGDQVLVEQGREPKEGDIVVAAVDGAWTIKYYRRKNGRIVLFPANPDYRPITPKEELRIAAVVTAVIRKYLN